MVDLLERLRSHSRYQLGEHSMAMHDAADEIELLRKRLADCVAWMDTREKMVPGMARICDMGRDALNKSE